MSQNKEFEAYLKRYADMYCDGDEEVAKEHMTVKEVERCYKEREKK